MIGKLKVPKEYDKWDIAEIFLKLNEVIDAVNKFEDKTTFADIHHGSMTPDVMKEVEDRLRKKLNLGVKKNT